MKRFAASFLLLLLVFFVAAKSQDRCNIRTAISPDIRGIKLGMDYESVKTMFPESIGFALAPKTDQFGVIDAVELGLVDFYKKPQFNGVKEMVLYFTDGKVTKIGAAYDEATQWNSIADFTAQVSKTLVLPLAWRNPTNADPLNARIMDCVGFRVIAQIGKDKPSFIGLVDVEAERVVNERKQAIEEKKRKEFKP